MSIKALTLALTSVSCRQVHPTILLQSACDFGTEEDVTARSGG